MKSLKKLKMKKSKNLFSTKEDVNKIHTSLKQKTVKAFIEFTKSKQKSFHQAHFIYLD